MPIRLSSVEFESLVEGELDALPSEMTDGLENVAFVIEDLAPDDVALLGRYEGVDLTRRDRYGFGEMPDRIVLFRETHLDAADTVDGLRAEVRTTLVHEIGHYYGLDDDRLHELGWA